MTPMECYLEKLKRSELSENPEQLRVMKRLDIIYHQLIKRQESQNSILGKLREKTKIKCFSPTPIKGLYLYGPVGTGKTLMLDLLFHSLPVRKKRLHFHAFMREIHLFLRKTQGQKNPLQTIAQQIAKQASVLCFDEFFVSDIADAMILKELLTALFKNGVCLIATSNIAPNDLYQDGLQREQFLPAIQLIKKNVHVIHLQYEIDYRLSHSSETVSLYFTPIDHSTNSKLNTLFKRFSKNTPIDSEPIEIAGRRINVIKKSNTTIWFDFYTICGRPRSTNDYLSLIKKYSSFFISNVPVFDNKTPDLLLSFIYLIDVLYDAQKKLVISAEASIENLYHGKKFRLAFKRTQSRLTDMQSRSDEREEN